VPLVHEFDERVADPNGQIGGRLGGPTPKLREERLVAGYDARIQERHLKLDVIGIDFGEIRQLSNVVPDGQLQIPKRLQDRVYYARFFPLNAALEQDQQVDIRVQAERTTTVPADRANHERLSGVPARGLDELPDNRIHLGCVLRLRRAAAPALPGGRDELATRARESFRKLRFLRPGAAHTRPTGLWITGDRLTNRVCVSR
jgi:hypothetical protein